MSVNLAALFQVDEPERSARLRELRMAALLLWGRAHPVTTAAAQALANPDEVVGLLDAIDTLPAIPRRRLLATLAATLPTEAVR